jgi:hypothetical protein
MVVKRKIPSPRKELNPRTPIIQPIAQHYTKHSLRKMVISSFSSNTS